MQVVMYSGETLTGVGEGAEMLREDEVRKGDDSGMGEVPMYRSGAIWQVKRCEVIPYVYWENFCMQ